MKAFLAALAAVLLTAVAASAGQRSDAASDPTGLAQQQPAPGWTLTPSFLVSRVSDDNVLMTGPGDPPVRDYINVYNPRGDLTYKGARSQFSARWDGAFLRYQDLATLNSFDQHAGIDATRKLSKRNSFVLNASANTSPTTEFLQLSGVPYVRTGTFTDDIRAGVESIVSNRTTITVGAHFGQARFDASQLYANLLLGGNSIGGGVSVRHRVSPRTILTVDADMQHATIGTVEQVFDIQHAVAGVEHELSEGIHVFASGGLSRLSVTDFGPPRTGPSWKLGYVHRIRETVIDVTFNRSYVPSFGFGGTTQNGDLTAHVHLPITRRIYTQDLISFQQQDPLVIAVPQLQSRWIQAAVGYAARSYIRIEAYFAGTRQTFGDTGARLEHNTFGIQVIATKPVRIR